MQLHSWDQLISHLNHHNIWIFSQSVNVKQGNNLHHWTVSYKVNKTVTANRNGCFRQFRCSLSSHSDCTKVCVCLKTVLTSLWLPSCFFVSFWSQLDASFARSGVEVEHQLPSSLKGTSQISEHRTHPHLFFFYHRLSLLCSCEDTEAPGALKCLHTLEIESNSINQDGLFFLPPFHSFFL